MRGSGSSAVKAALRESRPAVTGWAFLTFLRHDLTSGRMWGVLLIGLGNLLPDLFCFAVVRAALWRLAGARFANFSRTVIRSGAFTEYPRNLTAGTNFQINRNSYLGTNGQITIGDHVMISVNCGIHTVSHSGLEHEVDVVDPVVIKSHCLLYANSIVLPGTVMEEGVVLAAGAILKGPTKPWSIYAGVPAKFIKQREQPVADA